MKTKPTAKILTIIVVSVVVILQIFIILEIRDLQHGLNNLANNQNTVAATGQNQTQPQPNYTSKLDVISAQADGIAQKQLDNDGAIVKMLDGINSQIGSISTQLLSLQLK